ncbi:MAG TPA: D-alanine--D-serine ligase VanG [Clostridiaceae bacterium]|nr:D-alanine--D-serine ligase VanG [Clostridiaceae bacterium]
MKKIKVAIVFGGSSPEYEVSLQSAYTIISSLDKERHQPVLIGISRKGEWFRFSGDIGKIKSDTWCNDYDCVPAVISPNRLALSLLLITDNRVSRESIDLIFPVLHGKYGEDGTIQGLAELAGIPLVGSSVLSSALCMDKERAHKLVLAGGISVPNFTTVGRDYKTDDLLQRATDIGYPVFVKPVKAGSSFGASRVLSSSDLISAVEFAFQYDDRVIIEENITGIEVACAVLGTSELIVGEIDEVELSNGFFDYAEKYTPQKTTIHAPARISADKATEIKDSAKKIYRLLDCSCFARIDFFLSPEGKIIFNEANTIPGFTKHSRYPLMMKVAGLSMETVVDMMIELALDTQSQPLLSDNET